MGRMYGPISPPHERHRKNRGDHRERGQNGRIADFVHRLDRHIERAAALDFRGMRQWRTMFSTTTMASSTRMPMEKISAKSVIAVQRVAVEIENRQRQRQRHRNGQQHDQRFAPAQRERNQQRHRKRGDEQVLQQFVGFVLRRVAVIARDRDVQVTRQHVPAKRVDFSQRVFGNQCGVRALALGQRNRDRRILRICRASRLHPWRWRT